MLSLDSKVGTNSIRNQMDTSWKSATLKLSLMFQILKDLSAFILTNIQSKHWQPYSVSHFEQLIQCYYSIGHQFDTYYLMCINTLTFSYSAFITPTMRTSVQGRNSLYEKKKRNSSQNREAWLGFNLLYM